MKALKNKINKLKEEKLQIDLGPASAVNQMKSDQLAGLIQELEIDLEIIQLKNLLENFADRTAKQIDESRINGTHILKDNSYKTASTGYNFVADIEFTESFLQLQEALDTATEMSAIIENIM